MKHDQQISGHIDSGVGVIRTLAHMPQIMQSREVTKYSAKPVETERRTPPTFKERCVESDLIRND